MTLLETPPAGWRAALELGFTATGDITRLTHKRHLGPLRVQRPFYPEGGPCHVYLVHPPGGVVGGDELRIDVRVEAGAHALLTTPAASKFYRSAGHTARQTATLNVAGTLEWLPQETIYYPGALVRQNTRFQLAAGAKLIAWDAACFGLTAQAKPFDSGLLRQGLEVWRDDRPLLIDQLRIDGAGDAPAARWGLDGRTVLGTFVACPATRDDVEALRTAAGDDTDLAISLVDGVLIARAFGDHADAMMRLFTTLWRALRPRLLGRDAVPPRIWAT